MPKLDPAIGSFPGSIAIMYEWVPDPKVIAKELIAIADYLDNMQIPLRASKEVAQADMHERFATNSGPNGEAWAPLDEEYAVKKAAMGGDPSDPLTLTGALEAAAAGESAYMVDARNVWFNTGALPFYGILHEIGTGDPANVGVASQHRFQVREKLTKQEGGAHSNLGIGRGQALPSRPFIGLSADAEAQIFGIFDAWFYAGAQWGGGGGGTGRNMAEVYRADPSRYFIRPSGVVQERLPGGRFGKKIDTIVI